MDCFFPKGKKFDELRILIFIVDSIKLILQKTIHKVLKSNAFTSSFHTLHIHLSAKDLCEFLQY